MYYRSINDLNSIILKKLNILPKDFDLIVGVPRSGMLPANLLALYLNKPYTDLHSFLNGHIYKAGARGQFFDIKSFKKILIVDDSVGSGGAINEVKEKLKNMLNDFNFSYCTIYMAPGKEKMVDHYFEIVPFPRYFQWNVMNHTSLTKACFDIDGVLCVDPTDEENDDGEKYRHFILNATPLYIPGCKIGALVTSRLEKYRKETEEWLAKNNIKYNELIMLDLPNMEARRRLNNHAEHKAKAYQLKSYTLFIESSLSQAIEINKRTGKPVLCTENFQMIFDSESIIYNVQSGKYFPFLKNLALKLRNKLAEFRKPHKLILNTNSH
jgi:uncharacterized HAD superfamily protein/hypoxanthine phosphoribosyltransferase